jgi:diguanylate cyclase (GGDEF)-like protein/PAS domain S-box-containing protein
MSFNQETSPKRSVFGAASHKLLATWGLLGFILLGAVAVLGLSAVNIVSQRAAILADGQRDTTNLARSLKQHAELSFGKADVLLTAIVERLENDKLDQKALERLKAWFRQEVNQSSQFVSFAFVDSNGSLVLTTAGDGSSKQLSDRDYFTYHQTHDDDALHIGRPVLGRAAGDWLIPLTRRVNRPDGTFGGVAVAAIDPKYFQKFYNTIDLGKNGAVLLASLDGTLMVRRPFLESNIGRDLSNSGIFKQLKQSPRGTVAITALTDGITRLNSYEQDETYPFVVAVAKSVDEMLAPWQQYAMRRGFEAISVAAFMSLLGAAVWRSTRTLSRNSETLAKLNGDLLESKTLLSSTLAALGEGVVVQDEASHIISYNPSAERILGVNRDELLGATLPQLCRGAIREDGSDFPGDEHPAALALATNTPQETVVMGLKRGDGSINWISINSVPIKVDENSVPRLVVTSFVDITERKLAQETLAQAITAIPDGFVIYDNNDRLVVCNDAYKEIYAATAPAIKNGVTFSELLQYGIDRGQYPEAGQTAQQQSEWLTERLKWHFASNSDVVQQLPNGRWLQIRERRTASGYIVGVRTDVTQIKHETAKLQAVIENFPGGICFLDADYNVTTWNRSFLTLLDLPPELFDSGRVDLETVYRVKAERGEYGPGDPIEQVRLRVEAARIAEGQSFELTRPDGAVLEVRGNPIKGGGYITTYTDVTARHAAAQRLFESERLAQEKSSTLQLTLAHMSQGLSMYDASGRLIVWNDRYADIYCCPPDFLKSGLKVEEIAAHLSRIGYSGTDEPDWRQKIVDDNCFASTLRFNDGRAIRIVRRSIGGSGWVATHEDISEQVRAETELFQQSAELARTNLRFDAALTNMTQGLCLFDADRRLVISNARFQEIYNLPPEMVASGTSLEAILDHQYRNGVKDERTIEDNLRAIPSLGQQTVSTPDGRVISIRRTPVEGGGWVATHEDVTEQIHAQAEITRLARHDVLTGLANRAEFNAKLAEASKRVKRYGGAITVMMLDLDKFKAVNDTLGHPAGDKLLVEVAQRMKSSLRETDVLARLGGDEFAIIQEGGTTQHEGAIALALRIIHSITQPFDLDGHQANIGTSVGIAMAPEHGLEPEDLLKSADLALYAVKSGGRNDYRIFQPEMLEAAHSQQTAESELRDAIEREEFELYYQPVMDAKTLRISGAEALIRWRHPTRGLIGPDQFIPLAEMTGLIAPLGDWVLQRACADAASWPEHIRVAVNVSAVQFKKGNLFDVILCTLVETGLAPDRLELEITETVLLENQEAHLANIRQLKNLGISIALDDFGTGYSSMNYLTVFPFDKIKIDKSFTQGALNRRDYKAVIASTLALAQGLGTVTTAEGVETQEQLEYMREAGVTFVQGYLLGRPVPVSQLDIHNINSAQEMVA